MYASGVSRMFVSAARRLARLAAADALSSLRPISRTRDWSVFIIAANEIAASDTTNSAISWGIQPMLYRKTYSNLYPSLN